MNRTQRALQEASRALREATWALEAGLSKVETPDLPTSAITALAQATDAMGEALRTVEELHSERP